MFDTGKIHLLVIHSLMLLALHIIFGKKASFPYGVMVGFTPWAIGAAITLIDFIYFYLIIKILANSTKTTIFKKWRGRLIVRTARMENTRSFNYFRHFGRIGMAGLVIVPFTGGIFSAYFMGKMLKYEFKETYLIACISAVIGNAIFMLSSMGILHLAK